MSIVLLSLTLLGRVFQSFEPYTLNDLSESVCLLVEGTSFLKNTVQDVLSSFLL